MWFVAIVPIILLAVGLITLRSSRLDQARTGLPRNGRLLRHRRVAAGREAAEQPSPWHRRQTRLSCRDRRKGTQADDPRRSEEPSTSRPYPTKATSCNSALTVCWSRTTILFDHPMACFAMPTPQSRSPSQTPCVGTCLRPPTPSGERVQHPTCPAIIEDPSRCRTCGYRMACGDEAL